MDFSIVIPTKNRSTLILSCLNSVATAIDSANECSCEIIIVDNNSSDNTIEIITAWAKLNTNKIIVDTQTVPGLSACCNRGIQLSSGKIIIFTNDDCEMDEKYIVNYYNIDKSSPEIDLRGGMVTLGNSADLPLTIQTYPNIIRWHRSTGLGRGVPLGGGRILGCNLSIKRSLADKLGNFDERFGAGSKIPGGEDADYIYRAFLSDAYIEYNPNLLIRHFHGRKNMDDAKRLMKGYTIAAGALYGKYHVRHPNMIVKFDNIMRHTTKHNPSDEITASNGAALSLSTRKKIFYGLTGLYYYFKSIFQNVI